MACHGYTYCMAFNGGRIRYFITLFLTAVLLATAGCQTLNNGVDARPDTGPQIGEVRVYSETWWFGGEPGLIDVPWTGGVPPITIEIDTGTDENAPAGTNAGASPFIWGFTLPYEGYYDWRVVVTDALGRQDTATGAYWSQTGDNFSPTIVGVRFEDGTLYVEVSDPENDDVSVSITEIDGLLVDETTKIVPGGYGAAEFYWSAENKLEGGAGTVDISIDDSRGWDQDWDSIEIEIPPVVIEPAPGQLVAVPLSTTAGVGEVVTVQVVTGSFSAQAPFCYMNSVAITVPAGGDYEDDTFNAGRVGGQQKDVDGIWALMAPRPSTFFTPEEFMMKARAITGQPGLVFMDFNLTPVGAGETLEGGYLFNFGISFDATGEYPLGFIEFQDVQRTYFADAAGVGSTWTDLSNVLEGVETTVVVR